MERTFDAMKCKWDFKRETFFKEAVFHGWGLKCRSRKIPDQMQFQVALLSLPTDTQNVSIFLNKSLRSCLNTPVVLL